MTQQIEVDAHLNMEHQRDIFWVLENVENNGYVSHETYPGLVVIKTENGDIGVTSDNPTFSYGLVVNLHKLKHPELFENDE